MGYGQRFVTQSALLLDRMHDATQMLDWTAKEIYDPRIGSFIVPEAVQIDPTGDSGIGLATWVMECRKQKLSKLCAWSLESMTRNQNASRFFRECPTIGMRL